MFNQHAKWLKVTRDIPWRRPIASLNYLLTSHVWRQDHNGFSHQDPGFIDHVVNKKAEVIRVYLPPDANTPALGRRPLPAQPPLRERDRRRQAAGARTTSRWTTRSSTARAGIGIWEWASNDGGAEPGRRARLLRRRPDARDARRRGDPARAAARAEGARRQRRRPDAAPAGRREHPHGLLRQRVRRALHHRPAGRLRLPRLPVADPPAHLPAHEPRQPARARLQGGGHDDDAVRHGDARTTSTASTS